MIDAGELLTEAAQTLKERAAQRDTEKERAMAKTVALYNAMYPATQPMSETQGWFFMIALKAARSSQGQFRKDDFIDLASYAALMGECESQTPEPKP